MLFNPEDGKTTEEIVEIALCGLKPDIRARLERVSAVSGRSIRELVEECLDRFETYLDDPVNRAAYLASLDWEAQPYGVDPLLRKDR